MYIAALFTIATWKQPKCLSIDEWVKKMWYIYTMEYYSSIKRNKTVPLAEMWIDSETTIQSEVSQKEKNKYHISTYICAIQKNCMDEPISQAEIQTQMQRTNVWAPKGKVGVMNWEILGMTYIYYYV